MKILVFTYLFPNLVNPEFGIFVLNRLKAVSEYCDLIIINPVPWFPFCEKFSRYQNFNEIPKKEIIQGIEVFHPRFFIVPKYLKFFDSISYFFSVFHLTKRIYKNFKFDLIDLHWTYPDILAGTILSRYFNKRLVVNVRGKSALNIFPIPEGNQYYKEKSLRAIILGKLLPKADAIVTLSEELKTECINLGVLSEKIEVIQNGVNTSKFYYMDQKECRKKLTLPAERKIILSVGNLIFGKGFDRIIRALHFLIKKYPDILYCIAGSRGAAGDYTETLNKLIKTKGLNEYIFFAGQINHDAIAAWYNAADVFCLSSRSEGCPNVLMEALACGCPCVASDVGDVSNIVKYKFMGKVVDNSQEALKNGLVEVLAEKYDRKEIAAYMKENTWDKCAEKVVNLYSKTLKF